MGHKIKHKSKVKVEEVATEEVEYNDEFVDIANKALNTSIKYKYVVFAFIFVAIAIAGTLAFMDSSKKKQAVTLSQEFSNALAIYNAEVVPNSAADGQFKTSKEKFNKAIEKFTSFTVAHPNIELSNIAKMYIGNSFYELNDYDNAIKSYDSVISSSNDSSLKELLKLKKAEIFNDKKDLDKAIETFKAIDKSKNEYIASISLYNIAEIYKSKKNTKLAKEYLDKLNKEYPDSYYASKAKLDNKL